MFRLILTIGAFISLGITVEVAVQTDRSNSIRFEDITVRSGINFVTDSSPTPNKNQPETMVSGLGLIDYDNDGFPNFFLINGAAILSLKKESPNYSNRLFHTNKEGIFPAVTEKAGRAGNGKDLGLTAADWEKKG